MKKSHPVAIARLDSERFGVRVGRASIASPGELDPVMKACGELKVGLLVARVPAGSYRAAQALEKAGFFLTDTILVYIRKLAAPRELPPFSGRYRVVRASAGQEDALAEVARLAFENYRGHYGEDPRLEGYAAGDIYSSWALNCLRGLDGCGDVMLAWDGSKPVGLVTCRNISAARADFPLVGGIPGIGRRSLVMHDLIVAGLRWARDQGRTIAEAHVLMTNRPMQKSMIRAGFEPESAAYTFHRWFDS